jgi:hypothetical protein
MPGAPASFDPGSEFATVIVPLMVTVELHLITVPLGTVNVTPVLTLQVVN